ncbi:MAG: DUF502 domain-containing protein [Gemmatimonadota bacterium]
MEPERTPVTEAALGAHDERPRHGRLHKLRRVLMAGITVIAPLWVTGFVLWTLFKWTDERSRLLVEEFAGLLGYDGFYYRGIGFVVTFAIICAVGLVTTNVLGRRLLHEARQALEQLPVVRAIYAPVRQLMETMTSPERSGFRKVVLFEYPRRSLWTIGFVAGDVPFEKGGAPAHTVFVPTAPNPTTGFMLIVPREELRYTNLSIEAAFQMVLSAGVAVPLGLRLPESVRADDAPVAAHTIVQAVAAEAALAMAADRQPEAASARHLG